MSTELAPEPTQVVDPILALRQQELYRALEAKKQWIQSHRIYFHNTKFQQPDGSIVDYQEPFHKSKAKVRLAHGTNRSGKTTAGGAEDVSLCLGFHPWMLPSALKEHPISYLMSHMELIPKECLTRFKPPVKGLVIEDDWDTVDEILTVGTAERAGKLKLLIPDDALVAPPKKNALGHICKYEFKNGSILQIDTERSFINDPLSFEGKDYDFVHYDEPKCRDLRVAVGRGLVDTNGIEMFTMTALAEPWIYNEVYLKATSNPDIQTFFFDAHKNPNISQEGFKAFGATLTQDEYDARILGKWCFLKGKVYKEFIARSAKDGGHICEPISIEWVRENATVWGAIDPHQANPQTCLLMLADKKGRLIIWREVYKKCLIPEFCDAIKSEISFVDKDGQVKQLPIGGRVFWCDPIAFIEDPVDGRMWADEFELCGIPVDKAPKQKDWGVTKTRQAFKDNKLFICSNCVRTIYEIENYIYQEWSSKSVQRNPKEKPVDKDDHTMECMYRLVLKEPQFIDYSAPSRPIRRFDSCPRP